MNWKAVLNNQAIFIVCDRWFDARDVARRVLRDVDGAADDQHVVKPTDEEFVAHFSVRYEGHAPALERIIEKVHGPWREPL